LSVLTAKKRCFDIIETFPENQLVNLVVTLEASLRMVADVADDEYCAELFRSSFGEDNGNPMPFEEFIKEFGMGA